MRAPFVATLALIVVSASAARRATTATATVVQPVNNLPNPYREIDNYFKLPEGRWWESTSAVDVGVDGRAVWVAERCAANSCADSILNPVLEFDETGKLIARFGAGLFILPHGIHVDRDGNVWITDAAGPNGTDRARDGKGDVVYKFSPQGKVLLTLGRPGVPGDGTGPLLDAPTDVITAPNGDVFVADGHNGQGANAGPRAVARIVKFSATGAFIKSWGTLGSGPGQFKTPHGLAIDSRRRLFVADRGNNRIQIFTEDGAFLAEWKQFGRPSGIFIDAHDVLYVADSESTPATNPGWRKGIRIGSAKDGTVKYFIPDLARDPPPDGRSGADGVAADAAGNVYGARVNAGAMALVKYVRN